jgi:hypothetical protein
MVSRNPNIMPTNPLTRIAKTVIRRIYAVFFGLMLFLLFLFMVTGTKLLLN